MIANFVKFSVKPGCMEKFIDVSLKNSRGSINGPGCLATSIFPDPKDNRVAYVFEVFVNQAAYDHHHQQPYYKEWEEEVRDLEDGPYVLLQNTGFPSEESFKLLKAAVAGGDAL